VTLMAPSSGDPGFPDIQAAALILNATDVVGGDRRPDVPRASSAAYSY